MIKFFRRIRQKLLSENKFSKYLIYAIGEIVLVVIGILIALQINTWNNQREKKVEEIELLKELSVVLERDIEIFSNTMKNSANIIRSKEVIIRCIREDIPYHDSLEAHFNRFFLLSTYEVNTNAYDALEDWGLHMLSNDSLRRSIKYLYTNRLANFEDWLETEKVILFGSYIDMFGANFDTSGKIKPYDYEQFIQNEEFMRKETHFTWILKASLRSKRNMVNRFKGINSMVLTEIDRLKNS